MKQVESDLDSLRAHVFELKSSLYRAGRAHDAPRVRAAMSPFANFAATLLLGLFFLVL